MSDKKISFVAVGEGLYAFTAEGDPNSGVIIGDDCVMVVEAQATPRLAQKVPKHDDCTFRGRFGPDGSAGQQGCGHRRHCPES